jgi:hypothetical protein
MAGAPIIEIRELGRPVRRRIVERSIEVGRECDGELLADEGERAGHAGAPAGAGGGPAVAGVAMVGQDPRHVAAAGRAAVPGLHRALRCDIFLGAIGIKPNMELARQAGIAVNRGVVVDDRMETSVPGVFAAGDVAEHDGRTLGLWPIGAKQGEVAALNALGGNATLTSEVPATILKGAGIDLFSTARPAAQAGDEVIVDEDPDPAAPSYRRLLISEGRAVGAIAIVLGSHPEDVAAVSAAVKKRAQISPAQIAALRSGDWGVLKNAGRASEPAGA